MQSISIAIRGTNYVWNGSAWTDERFLTPPTHVRHLLMTRLVEQLRDIEDADIAVDLVLDAARTCRDDGHLAEAEHLATRVLTADADNVDAATVLGSILRRRRLPRQAIKVTDAFDRRHHPELLVMRAAAFADIGDWDNADRLVRRAVRLERRDAGPETLQVMARVVAARTRSA